MPNTPPESTPTIYRVDLAALYPACFDWKRPRPLKIGLDRDLIEAGHAPLAVQRSLRSYCARGCYLKEMRAGAPRIDLQGTPVGVVSTEEAAAALARLQGLLTPCLSCPSIPVDQSDTQRLIEARLYGERLGRQESRLDIAGRLLALGKLNDADIAQATALNLDQVQRLARTDPPHADFADECRRQCRLVAQADMADKDLPRFLEATLADVIDWKEKET